MVFPFPGGPNNRRPLAGDLKPVNSWGMEDRENDNQHRLYVYLLVILTGAGVLNGMNA